MSEQTEAEWWKEVLERWEAMSYEDQVQFFRRTSKLELSTVLLLAALMARTNDQP